MVTQFHNAQSYFKEKNKCADSMRNEGEGIATKKKWVLPKKLSIQKFNVT